MKIALIYSRNNQIIYLVILLNLLILRTVIPYLEYLFVLSVLLSIPLLLFYRKNIFSKSFTFKNVHILYSYLTVTFLFILAFINNNFYNLLIIRQLVVAIFLLYYIFLCLLVIQSNDDLEYFINTFTKQIICITAIAAISGILKFLLEIFGIQFGFLFVNGLYPAGTSLKSDHNFYALTLLIGFIFTIFRLYHDNKHRLILNLLLIIYLINVLLTSSRRALILIIVINLIIISLWLFKKGRFNVLIKSIRYYLISVFIVLATIFIVVFTGFPEKAGGEFEFKNDLAAITWDYSTIFKRDVSIEETYEKLWKSDLSDDRRLNYDKKTYQQSESVDDSINQTGNNDLSGSIQNPMPDWNSWMTIRLDSYKPSNNEIIRIEGSHPSANLYKFIYFDTSITEIYISLNLKLEVWSKYERIEIRSNDEKIVKRIPKELDDGRWHNFEFNTKIKPSKEIQILLYFTGENIHNPGRILVNNIRISDRPLINSGDLINETERLNSINIPAHNPPQDHPGEIETETIPWNIWGNIYMDSVSSGNSLIIYTFTDGLGGTAYKDISIPNTQFWEINALASSIHAARNLRIEIRNLNSENFIYSRYPNKTQDMIMDYEWEKLSGYFFASKGDTIRLILRLYDDTIPQLVFWRNISITSAGYNKDHPIKDFAETEDISRLADIARSRMSELMENNIQIRDSYFSPRIARWKYAVDLFTAYSITQKIFGGGFSYLQKYMNRYQNNTHIDYPHNIFLSVLLYSGILGLLAFLWLIINTIYYYIKNNLYQLFSVFLMILLFVSFSSDSMFELPLFTAFLILPAIYHMKILKNIH